MYDNREMHSVALRRFEQGDIPAKVRWINDPRVSRYLHYDLPLEVEKTEKWFLKNKGREDRFDGVILVDGRSVGLTGLLSIDYNRRDAEFYITIGEPEWFSKGIGSKATLAMLNCAFGEFALNSVYLSTERENLRAIRLYERLGFSRDTALEKEGSSIICFRINKYDISFGNATPIERVHADIDNEIFIKRDDLYPYSFGGNKARKAGFFFKEIDAGDYDCVVTYGSSSSNHCRVVANMSAQRGMDCYIIGPEECSETTNNSRLMKLFGARITTVPVRDVHDTIEELLRRLKESGKKPYFIPGGGHGNLGTSAYADCYREIQSFEKNNKLFFDYIFFASGTGTTHAGLVCGSLLSKDERKIVGISIARENPRGRDVVLDSVREYLSEKKFIVSNETIEAATVFCDDYIRGGYAKTDDKVTQTINQMLIANGIPLDCTYTGKAYAGMIDYIKKNNITNQRILFIHTGGTPLFFDHLLKQDQIENG